MSSEQDFRPRSNPSDPRKKPEAWLSASKAVTLGARGARNGYSERDLVSRAAAGQLRSWAEVLVVGETRWSGGEIPSKFWEEFRFGKTQDWNVGDFDISVEGRFQVEAQGVSFSLGDLEMLFPKSFHGTPRNKVPKAKALDRTATIQPDTRAKGGRKLSPSWPEWVAELVAHIHENGIPEGHGAGGVDVVLAAVAERLAARGLEGPARSTTHDTMRAVLLRMRGAGT